MMMLVLMIIAFVFGAVTIVAVEAVGVLFLIRWLNRKVEKQKAKANEESSMSAELDPSFYNKQGFLWVLEPEKVPKHLDKVPREQKPKKDFLEIIPVRKHAKIKDHCLILKEPDGSHTRISLKGCIIEAVSASGLPSRKWAKRFPLRVENKELDIYKGCKTFYVYLETSWEKESWCKALRLASFDDKEKLKWFAKLDVEFHSYLTSLNAEYPSFMKPPLGINADLVDKSMKIDGSSSKVRQFFRKFTKKPSKSGLEIKTSSTPMSSREERKITEKCYSFDDPALVKMVPTIKPPNPSAEGSMLRSSSSSSSTSGTRSEMSLISERDPDDRMFADEGTLCLNLLLSRLFFDAKSNMQMKTALKSRIQRMLSNIRSPSFIGEVFCTSVDTGNLPPYIHGMRVVPSDMNEVWAMEIDIEYAGGAVLGIETRLEVRELDSQEGEETNLESSSVGEFTPDLLEGIEYFGKQLNLPEDSVNEKEQKDERDHKPDDNRSSKITTRLSSQVSRWRSVLHSVAKQVSQVPLSLGIKVASLRGTARLYIKPPPSDQIWFGFTSMPLIDFNLEPFVGEHKVTSGHLVLFMISRFKAAIRETLVLPNCESVCIPWMLAETDDWVPRNVAPFMWIHQDGAANTTTKHEAPSSQIGDVASVVDSSKEAPSACQDDKHDKSEKVGCSTQPTSESLDLHASSASTAHSTSNDQPMQDLRTQSLQDLRTQPLPDLRTQPLPDLRTQPLQELRTPLLENDEPREIPQSIPEQRRECQSRSQSPILTNEQSQIMEDDDAGRFKRNFSRARMLGLGKKMGEKLEEKRRHLEEKGRHIVEKMRDNRN